MRGWIVRERPWWSRGLGMAVIQAAVQTGLSAVRLQLPEHAAPFQVLALILVLGAGVGWGIRDFRSRAGTFAELGRWWLRAALLAGVVSGLLATLAKALVVDSGSIADMPVALTGGAAFTALLVLASTMAGAALARSRGWTRPAPSRPHTPEPETAAERTTPLTRVRG